MISFQIGGPVTDLFVNRERTLELILEGIYRNHFALIGLRRVRKTSLTHLLSLEKEMIITKELIDSLNMVNGRSS